MSAKSAHLTLRPDLCNGCGACVTACSLGAVRVGAGYLVVDWRACNDCCACVEACDRHAIQRTVVPLRSTAVPAAAVAPGDVTKIVVGSRAEAKAVRKAAEQSAKQASRASARVASGRRPTARRARKTDPEAAANESVGRPAVAAKVAAADAPAVDASAVASESTPSAGVRFLGRMPAEESASTNSGSSRDDGKPAARRSVPFGVVNWTLPDAAIVLGLLALSIVGKNYVGALPAIALMPAAGQAATRAGVLATYYAIQLGALALLAARHGTTLMTAFGLRAREADARLTGERRSGIVSAGLVVVALVAVEVVAIGHGLAMQSLHLREPVGLSSDVSAVFGGGEVGLLVAAVLVAVVAPLAEELAFRGVIMTSLGRRLGMWPAIGISAVLFAAYHMSVWLFFPMLALGFVLGWLAWARRSLWPAIATHVLYNGLAVMAAFLVPR
jgi:CAAX protease family protein